MNRSGDIKKEEDIRSEKKIKSKFELPTVLIVDDEKNILNSLKRLLRKERYNLITALGGEEALSILKDHDVQVVVSDLGMPQMSGTELLSRVKNKYPDIIRIILTGYMDSDSIIHSVNEGHIHKFFIKPWDDRELKMEIAEALQLYRLQQARKRREYFKDSSGSSLGEIPVEKAPTPRIPEKKPEDVHAESGSCLQDLVLAALPFPLLAVDTEGKILISNRLASGLGLVHDSAETGSDIPEKVPDNLKKLLYQVIDSGSSMLYTGLNIAGKNFKISCSPLQSEEGLTGVVYIFFPL